MPQFITVEDKIIGPLTLKQAMFLGGGAFIIFLLRVFFQRGIFWPLALSVAVFAAALSFLQIDGRPFWIIFKNWIFYTIRPRVYIWKQTPPQEKKITMQERKKEELQIAKIPKLSESKLSDLAWSLDIKKEEEMDRGET